MWIRKKMFCLRLCVITYSRYQIPCKILTQEKTLKFLTWTEKPTFSIYYVWLYAREDFLRKSPAASAFVEIVMLRPRGLDVRIRERVLRNTFYVWMSIYFHNDHRNYVYHYNHICIPLWTVRLAVSERTRREWKRGRQRYEGEEMLSFDLRFRFKPLKRAVGQGHIHIAVNLNIQWLIDLE